MTSCEEGRFCGSCQKTVLDFTQKSELEIQELLAKQTGKVCGRFYTHQLAQPVHSNRFSFRRVFSSVLVLLGLSFLSKEAEAQQKKKVTEKKQTHAKSKTPQIDTRIEIGLVSIDGPMPNSDVVNSPEVMPQFKFGGEAGFQKFFNSNKRSFKDDVEGLVVTSFIVDTLGKVTDIQILKTLSDEANTEALRLTSLLEFEPGMQNGRKVKVRLTLPVRFYKEEKK